MDEVTEYGWVTPADSETLERRLEEFRPVARGLLQELATIEPETEGLADSEPAMTVTLRTLFGSQLLVYSGSEAAYDAYVDEHEPADIHTLGAEGVNHVAWHDPAMAGPLVAATFEADPAAAAEVVRRASLAHVYGAHLP